MPVHEAQYGRCEADVAKNVQGGDTMLLFMCLEHQAGLRTHSTTSQCPE